MPGSSSKFSAYRLANVCNPNPEECDAFVWDKDGCEFRACKLKKCKDCATCHIHKNVAVLDTPRPINLDDEAPAAVHAKKKRVIAEEEEEVVCMNVPPPRSAGQPSSSSQQQPSAGQPSSSGVSASLLQSFSQMSLAKEASKMLRQDVNRECVFFAASLSPQVQQQMTSDVASVWLHYRTMCPIGTRKQKTIRDEILRMYYVQERLVYGDIDTKLATEVLRLLNRKDIRLFILNKASLLNRDMWLNTFPKEVLP